MAVENNEGEHNGSGFRMAGVVKALAILFVVAIYMIIFLKILFLQ